jgi:tRNA (guanine37-N1)-methyltransferase
VFEFEVVTIFPELISAFSETSLIGKARQKGLLSINAIDLRSYTNDRHHSVDDTPYGGGSGMVMKPGPILELIDAMRPCHKVLLTPQGVPFNQASARSMTGLSPLLLFCGRYEGVDERVRDLFDQEISIGDFVLNGGEVGAWAIIEAVSRLLPGVLGNEESTVEESFSAGLLEYPQYTRPEVAMGKRVPAVLLSGDHGKIARWRRGQALLRTRDRRPDLFAKLELSDDDRANLIEAEQSVETPDNAGRHQ